MSKQLFLILLLCLSAQLFATPTVGGTTGLIIMPTAESLNYKEFNIGADWSTSAVSNNGQVLWKYKANIGAFNGLELGFVGQNDREGVFINMKYYLLSDNTKYPLKMALGINNLTSYNKTDAYMVASKRLNSQYAGHFGFRADLADGKTNASLMLGLEYFISDKMAWISDLDGEDSKYLINTGVRYAFHPNAMVSLYALNLTNQEISAEYPGLKFNLGFTWTEFM